VGGAVLDSRSVFVAGTAGDDVAVDRVEISGDGATWVLASGTASWSGAVTLAPGANTIYARATDTSGNSRTVTVRVTLELGPQLTTETALLIALAVTGSLTGAFAVLWLRERRRSRRGPTPPAT